MPRLPHKVTLIALAAAVGVSGLMAVIPPPAEWRYVAPNGPANGTGYAYAYVRSAEGARLEVACKDGAPLMIAIQAPDSLLSEEGYRSRVIEYRFDKGPVQSTWGRISDDLIAFDGDTKRGDVAILQALPLATTLFVQTIDGEQDSVQYSFPAKGAADSMKKVREGCSALPPKAKSG